MSDVILSVLAHPDDAEFVCAGTLARLAREHKWEVHIATMTPGDCGSATMTPDETARTRRSEGAHAAALIGAEFHCAEARDLLVFYDRPTLEAVVRLLRHVRPTVVLTHNPRDYHMDHEQTSSVVRAACFAAPIGNFLAEPDLPPIDHVPHLYYCDPIDGKDQFGRPMPPEFCVDVSSVIDTKAEMLACHVSQRDWLRKHHGMDQYLVAMRESSARHGSLCGVPFAEGYRQHLGHGYPQDDRLGALLGRLAPTAG